MKVFACFAALLLPFSLSAKGSTGHVTVEALSSNGSWIQAGQLAFDQDQSAQELVFPAALAAPSLKLRLTQADSDETQYDALSLRADGKALKAAKLTRAEDGAELSAKLAKADRDVVEMHDRTLLGAWSLPQGAKLIRLTLEARSAYSKDLAAAPFQIWDQDKPFRLEASEGSLLRFHSGKRSTGSGHPSALLVGDLRVEGGKLKGGLDFGPDNDPGAEDYASLVAFGPGGEKKEFRVTPKDSRWGKASMAYGKAASWEHMRYDFEVPLSELPRQKDGSLGLGLLAYGTCSVNQDTCTNAINAGVTSTASGSALTVTVQAYAPSNNPSFYYLTFTGRAIVYLRDAGGNTVYSHTNDYTYYTSNYICPPQQTFLVTAYCPGTYSLVCDFANTGDGNLANSFGCGALVTKSLDYIGACVATPTPTVTPTFTPIPTLGGAVDEPVLGPNPAPRGTDLCASLPSGASVQSWEVYNSAGERVSKLSLGDRDQACLKTGDLGQGLYWVRMEIQVAGGKKTYLKKVVIK